MRALNKLWLRARSLLLRRRVDRELERELRFHLDHLIEENVSGGMSPPAARRAALRALGGVAQFQEECRDMRQVAYIDDLCRDFGYAARGLRRNRGFAALVVLILSLGIGANTAVFSVVNAVLLAALPYDDPERIVALEGRFTLPGAAASGGLSRQIAVLDFDGWREQASSFEAIAFYRSDETVAMPGETAEYARATLTSPEFFRVFGVEPLLGRAFLAADTEQDSAGAAVISHAYWQSRFSGDPAVLGRTLRMRGRARAIVGVMPEGFQFPDKTDLWYPANEIRPDARGYGAWNYLAIGRLAPGVALAEAQAEMTAIAARIEQQHPDQNKGRGVAVTRLGDALVSDARRTLYLLLGAVGAVLLIACANTATLLLGKASARGREIAVRVALGAGRRRIVRQLITESLVLALLAGGAGLLLAYWGAKALVAMGPADMPRLAEASIDAGALGFTLVVSLATSVLFGLAPALHASKVDLNDALKAGGTRSVVGGERRSLRAALVAAEIALAVTLLAGAGLLIKSFAALQTVALGFQPENVLVMRATAPSSSTEARPFFRDVLAKIATLPGVSAVGATMAPPGNAGSTSATGSIFIDRMPPPSEFDSAIGGVLSIVSPGTFAALGIPVKAGRDFDENDTPDRPRVAVVNEALVRAAFRNEDPIGRTVFCTFDSPEGMTIVGVVGDVRQYGPAREPSAECYMPYTQHPFNNSTMSIVVRTATDPNALAGSVRRVAQERSPEVAMQLTTMESRMSDTVAAPRFRTLLLGLFAGLAVCLAMAGVYGVVAHAVGQRTSEIGLRMALGASRSSVRRLVLGQGLAMAGVGLAAGLAAAIAGSRLLSAMLFQVQPGDPLVYIAVAALLAAATLAASYVPAMRAARINPMTALRRD